MSEQTPPNSSPGNTKAPSLDRSLAGLAMYEAWTKNDHDALVAMFTSMPAAEAHHALLSSMEVMCGIFAHRLGISDQQVVESVRRRIVQRLQTHGAS